MRKLIHFNVDIVPTHNDVLLKTRLIISLFNQWNSGSTETFLLYLEQINGNTRVPLRLYSCWAVSSHVSFENVEGTMRGGGNNSNLITHNRTLLLVIHKEFYAETTVIICHKKYLWDRNISIYFFLVIVLNITLKKNVIIRSKDVSSHIWSTL